MKVTTKRLPEVNTPILILHSKNDSINSPEGAKFIYNSISTPKDQKQIVWFEKTEHDMFLDCEREEIARIVIENVKERIKIHSSLGCKSNNRKGEQTWMCTK
jgi:carboxylesterase